MRRWLIGSLAALIYFCATPALCEEVEKRHVQNNAPSAHDIVTFLYQHYFMDLESFILLYEGEQPPFPISRSGSFLINPTEKEIREAANKRVDIINVYKPLPELRGDNLLRDLKMIEATGAFSIDAVSSNSLSIIASDLAESDDWQLNKRVGTVTLPITLRDALNIFIESGLYSTGPDSLHGHRKLADELGDRVIWPEGTSLDDKRLRDLLIDYLRVVQAARQNNPFQASPVRARAGKAEWSYGALPKFRSEPGPTSIPAALSSDVK